MSGSTEGWLLLKGQGAEKVTSMARPGQARPDHVRPDQARPDLSQGREQARGWKPGSVKSPDCQTMMMTREGRDWAGMSAYGWHQDQAW